MRRLLAGIAAAGVIFLTAPPASAATTHDVSMQGTAYNPPSTTITVGDSVKWTNNEGVVGPNHTATSDTAAFTSPTLMPGNSYTETFNAAGTFAYHCEIHPSMHGTIVVRAAVTTTTRPVTTTAPRPTTTRPAVTTTRPSTSTTSETSTTLAEETTTTAEDTTTTTSGDIAIDTDEGGGTNGLAVGALVVGILAVLGGGGYAIWRIRGGA